MMWDVGFILLRQNPVTLYDLWAGALTYKKRVYLSPVLGR
jgi:hypothetical protein